MSYPPILRTDLRRRRVSRLDKTSSPHTLRSKQQQRHRPSGRNQAFRPILCTGSQKFQALRVDVILRPIQVREVRQILRIIRCQANRQCLLYRVRQGAQPGTGPNYKRTNPTTDRRTQIHTATRLFVILLVPRVEAKSRAWWWRSNQYTIKQIKKQVTPGVTVKDDERTGIVIKISQDKEKALVRFPDGTEWIEYYKIEIVW